MKKSTKCLGDRSACFCVENEWQKNASGKVTCDAESGKLGALQVGGCWGEARSARLGWMWPDGRESKIKESL